MKLPNGRRHPRIGRLPYLVATPFTFHWPSGNNTYEWITAPPRQLAHLAREDELDAACLPVLDARSLSRRFEPLGELGIAVQSALPIAVFFARIEADLLGKAQIGITDQGAATVQLLEVLLVHRFGVETPHLVPLSPDRRQFGGWLAVGDEALRLAPASDEVFPHRYDLLQEWNQWTGLPFVLGRWVVRKSLPDEVKADLHDTIEACLHAAAQKPESVVEYHAEEHEMEWDARATGYLHECTYHLGAKALESIDHFAKLVRELRQEKTSWRDLLDSPLPFP